MNVHYPTDTEPATADYVLSVIRDEHRQQCQYDPEANAAAVLTFDSTVAEWRDACDLDLLTWRELRRALGAHWNIDCSDEEWRRVLEPARRKRLSDVCELIASRTLRHKVRPTRMLGRTCHEAGTFLTIRSLLVDAGADAKTITPSAQLAPCTRKHLSTFLGSIARLSPGSLPTVKVSHPAYDAACWTMIASSLILLLGSALFLNSARVAAA